MSDLASTIAENVARIRQRIAEAARRGGRSADEIALVAVTKYVGPEEIRAVVEAGCRQLGESRPQQFWDKAEAVADLPIRWHMIGQLQRNKIRRTLPLIEILESADNPRLIDAVDRIAGEQSLCVPLLLEVNISGEAAKHGFEPDRIEPYLEELAAYKNVEVRGLMGMAGLEGGPDVARRDFAALREIRDRLRTNCPEGICLDQLSMGMSRDFEIAIEQGATMVRVGSALYEGLPR